MILWKFVCPNLLIIKELEYSIKLLKKIIHKNLTKKKQWKLNV